MDADDVPDHVTAELKTELSRLGSSKSLFADTGGEMETDAVLAALAGTTANAAGVFEGWGETFADAAAGERDRADRIAAELDGDDPGEPPAVVAALAGAEDPAARLGAAVGYTMVAERKAGQATGFFTGQADPGTASLFRGVSDEYEQLRADLLGALEGHDTEAAAEAAVEVVRAAYEEYVERLEAQGVNPKPVC